jgi:hypothetical protein
MRPDPIAGCDLPAAHAKQARKSETPVRAVPTLHSATNPRVFNKPYANGMGVIA